jgi:hypothetical protein
MINRLNLKPYLIILFSLTTQVTQAQSAITEVEILQEAFGLEKKAAVANFMDLGDSAERFWKIYDEYEAERKKLGSNRIMIIAEYASNYPNISEDQILSIFKRTKALKDSFDKLQETYFNRMRKEVGVSKAAQFIQIESYFSAIIQASIYSQLPFIGESIKGK